MFRELVMPYYKRGLDWVHRHTRMKVFMHNDGAIFDFIPSLIEMGVDILNPVHIRAAGMEPAALKRDFGAALCLMGGIDASQLLPLGSEAEVRQAVRRTIAGAGANLAIGERSRAPGPDDARARWPPRTTSRIVLARPPRSDPAGKPQEIRSTSPRQSFRSLSRGLRCTSNQRLTAVTSTSPLGF
mgnify:CR=1 FL=1